eukprot:6195510-Pleurochrysis_carterae.AAC.1
MISTLRCGSVTGHVACLAAGNAACVMAAAAQASAAPAETGHELAPAFEATKLAQQEPSTAAYIESLKAGAYAAVHYRPNVTREWMPCVMRRSASGSSCLVFMPSTNVPVQTFPIGLNENGTPIDE